jgi:hypothetical protein
MSAEVFISLQLSYLFMVSSALDLWVRDADQIEGRRWRVEMRRRVSQYLR